MRQRLATDIPNRATRPRIGLPGTLVVLMGCFAATGACQPPDSDPNPAREAVERRKELAETALSRMDEHDTFAAIEVLAGYDDSLVATHAFALVAKDLYSNRKDLPGAVAIARGGIQFGLTAALDIEPGDRGLADHLRSAAKVMASDLASFTWPGWDEEGIEIGPGELAIGLDAAKTNLRLAKALKQGDTSIGRAYWMLGAHRLARHEFDTARKRFERSAEHFEYAGNRAEGLLSLGFVAVADLIEQPGDEKAIQTLGGVKAELKDVKNGEILTSQLDTALEALQRHEGVQEGAPEHE